MRSSPTRVAPPAGRPANELVEEDEDDRFIRSMGYKLELRRGFNRLSSFSFCYTSVAVLGSFSMLYNYGLKTGGPSVMVWGWIVTGIMTVAAGASLGEICSTYPSAGSVYHWSAEMGSGRWGPFWAFLTAWFNFLGNIASCVSTAYGFSEALTAILATHGQELTIPIMVAIAIACVAVWAVVNTLPVNHQAPINNFTTVWSIGTTFAIVVAILVVPNQRAPSSQVWFETRNDTGFRAFPYVALLGLLTSTFTLAGYESAAHVAEETRDASRSAPLAIVNTCITASIMGFIYMLGLLYATTDIETAANSQNGAVAVFMMAAGPTVGRVLSNLLLSNLFLSGICAITASSRLGFAMARDNLLPGSTFFRHVNDKTQVPVRLVGLCTVFSMVLLLLPLLTDLAFEAFTSIDTIGYQVSYAIPIILRVAQGSAFPQSHFNLGRWSMPIAMISAAYLTITSIFFFWPSQAPITYNNFNYTAVVFVITFAVGGIYWVSYARHHFRGPRQLPKHELEAVHADEGKSVEITEKHHTGI